MAFASSSFAMPDIDINHHNGNDTEGVKSTNKNSNSNRNQNSNYNKSLSNSNAYSHSSNKTKVDVDASSRSKSKSTSGAFSGGNSVDVRGDNYNLPANTAAMSVGGICTDSAAAQGNNAGISISRANPVCEKLKMFELYQRLGMEEEAKAALKDAEALADIRGFFRGMLTVITLGIL